MKRFALIVTSLTVFCLLAIYGLLRASLPILDGTAIIEGLTATVSVERDSLGVVTIRGSNRLDVARATGFVHAQDRLFQMDLMRRDAAGELAALMGSATLERDKVRRLHRLRTTARSVISMMTKRERSVLEAYSEGVNTGIRSLGTSPFEYLVLRVDPEPWQPEDSILSVFAMYFQLNDELALRDLNLGRLHDALPESLFAFLTPSGTSWDAPIIGRKFETSPIPGPEICDLRGVNTSRLKIERGPEDEIANFESLLGSNAWAVAAHRTSNGHAILANDMHLGLRVPNTWYRVRFIVENPEDPDKKIDVSGASLPGMPVVVVGSNTYVAWGFTNSRGDWSDRVKLELDSTDKNRYRTPDGYQQFNLYPEIVRVKGGEDVLVNIRSTIWGPVIDGPDAHHPHALRWLAHLPEATNIRLMDMEHAHNVHDALRIASRAGAPPQNFQVVDREGNIAWTILGRIPRRVGYNPQLPSSWADKGVGWNGWLADEDYPSIVNPPHGQIWTANARIVDGKMLERIGDGGYRLGARARQIRDRLLALESASIDNMLEIQLDDQALFLERWRNLLLGMLDQTAVDGHPQRRLLRQIVENWRGYAAVDAVGYRFVREFRRLTHDTVIDGVLAGCAPVTSGLKLTRMDQTEGPLWKLVTERPAHLLPSGYSSWNELLLSAVDDVIESCGVESLDECTWGKINFVSVGHPLSRKLTMLAPWLDAHNGPLPGGKYVPRVQRPHSGASQRLAVSPGHENEGYFHMPGGQSGHPLSSFYRAGHAAWAQGYQIPFLPGEPIHLLSLHPL